MKKGVGVIDFINRIVQILKQDLRQLRISIWDAELIKPVELWDKGQLSHMTRTQYMHEFGIWEYYILKISNIPTY